MKLLLSLLLTSISFAQSVTVVDVQGIANLALANTSTLQVVTGSDGTVCTLSKLLNGKIYAWFNCSLNNQVIKTVQIQSTSTVSGYMIIGQGQALCLIGINPTNAAIAFGSVGSAPANGMAWSCANGSSTVLSGTISWP